MEKPWETEPDELKWVSPTGLRCELWRNQGGVWCGYVFLPPGHPCYEKPYHEIDVEVHGGLTFSNEYHFFWQVGFDCGHWGDYSPGLAKSLVEIGMYISAEDYALQHPEIIYRTMEFAKAETEKLATQFANMVVKDAHESKLNG